MSSNLYVANIRGMISRTVVVMLENACGVEVMDEWLRGLVEHCR
jgi:hypothetical protein